MRACEIIEAVDQENDRLSDAIRLKRVVAAFQRNLGEIFGNAKVQRRNRRYLINVAVYEKPISGRGQGYRMDAKQIATWVKLAADRAHPRLYRRYKVNVLPWITGHASHKLFAPVKIVVQT